MNTTARLITVLVIAASSACGAASATTPPAVVALARARQDDASAELTAGLALEAGHWLVNRDGVVVRMVNDPRVDPRSLIADLDGTGANRPARRT
jgi:hypothetical protein